MIDFTTFYKEHLPLLNTIASRYSLSYHDSQDSIQDIAIEFWRKLQSGKVDSEKNPTKYLSQLACWRIIDKLQNKKIYNDNHCDFGEENNLDELPERPKTPYEKREDLKLAIEAVSRFSQPRDVAIFKSYLDGEDIDLTAQKLNINKETVYVVRHRFSRKVIKKAKEML